MSAALSRREQLQLWREQKGKENAKAADAKENARTPGPSKVAKDSGARRAPLASRGNAPVGLNATLSGGAAVAPLAKRPVAASPVPKAPPSSRKPVQPVAEAPVEPRLLGTETALPETSPRSSQTGAPPPTPAAERVPIAAPSAADVETALAAITEGAMEDLSSIQPALSDGLDVTASVLDGIDLVLPDVSPVKEAPVAEQLPAPAATPSDECEGELAGVDTAALQRALDLCVPAPAAPAATPCEGEPAAVDTSALQRALDLCAAAPAAPAATPCEGEPAAVDTSALQRALDLCVPAAAAPPGTPAEEVLEDASLPGRLQEALSAMEDALSDADAEEESWPGSRRLSTVSSATAVSPMPTRMLSFTSAKPEVVASASPNAAGPRSTRTDRTVLDLDATEPQVWPACVLDSSTVSEAAPPPAGSRPAVQQCAALALGRRVSPAAAEGSRADLLEAENAELRARVAKLEQRAAGSEELYYKLEKQQNEFFQILVKMADEMAKTREEGPDDRADFRRRTML